MLLKKKPEQKHLLVYLEMTRETKKRLDNWMNQNYEWLAGEISTNIAKNQMSEYSGDLISHMVESAYKLDDEKVSKMLDNNKLGWYLLTGAGIQLRSSTSPFYRIYRHQKTWAREPGLPNSDKNIFDKEYEEYNDELYECFQKAWDELDWYLKTIMNKYFYENMSLLELHQYYNISKTHLIKDLNRGINQIRNKCNDC